MHIKNKTLPKKEELKTIKRKKCDKQIALSKNIGPDINCTLLTKHKPITTKKIAGNIQKTEKLLKLVGPNSNCMVKTKHWLKKKLKTIAKLHCQNILDLTDIARCKKKLPAHGETKQRYHRKH